MAPPTFYVSRVRAKAFKNVGSEWRELSFERGLNAIVGECWADEKR